MGAIALPQMNWEMDMKYNNSVIKFRKAITFVGFLSKDITNLKNNVQIYTLKIEKPHNNSYILQTSVIVSYIWLGFASWT